MSEARKGGTMYTYKRAAEALVAMRKEMDIGNLFQTDAYGLARSFADTIGWWESQADKDQAIKDRASLILMDKDEELLDLRLALRITEQETGDLKEERDQLVDENLELMRRNAANELTLSAIESVLGIGR
jgi:hypothetical protein